MSTHNIGFYEDSTKIIFQLSSNIRFISSSVSHLRPLSSFLSFCLLSQTVSSFSLECPNPNFLINPRVISTWINLSAFVTVKKNH